MSKFIKAIAVALALISSHSFAATVHASDYFKLKVAKTTTWLGYEAHRFKYTITAVEDGLVISNIVINRGKCKTDIVVPYTAEENRKLAENIHRGTHHQLPDKTGWDFRKEMNYSDVWSFTSRTDASFSQCYPMEVMVKTNKGNFTFKY